MISRTGFFGFLIASAATFLAASLLAALPERVPNTTLQLPNELPPGTYTTTNAFPGVQFFLPVKVAFPPHETNRLFVVESTGKIFVITNLSSPTKTLFLDLTSRIAASGEGGLLSLVFHPNYASNGFFYVFYTLNTTTDAGTGFHDRLARFEVSPVDPNLALNDSELPLITQFDDSANHNAGDLHFGPDGYLYLSLGDEGHSNTENTQIINKDFFSAVLRIDVDKRPGNLAPNPHPASTSNYSIPADNPFIGATQFNGRAISPETVRTEFWAVGFRNPWRFSFDSVTGDLYLGDVGSSSREEIDVVVRGGNYGWAYREGTESFSGTPPPDNVLTEPIMDYGRSGDLGGGAVTGGYVYRGSRIPELYGTYIFGDFMSGNIFALRYDGATAQDFRRIISWSGAVGYNGGPSSFGVDPSNGDILMTEYKYGDGRIRRLIKVNEPSSDPLPQTLAETGAFADLSTLTPNPGIVPYEINLPFWSDYASKTRWFSIPNVDLAAGFAPSNNWAFPTGTVWIKHFEIQMTNGVPESARRLETRFLVRTEDNVYGLTYRWDSLSNAVLVPESGMDEVLTINDGGVIRTQTWHYPGRVECLVCHTPAGGFALGFNSFQINRDHDYGSILTNQILALGHMGYFTNPPASANGLPRYARATDESVSSEHRVRSYLGANCVQCHQGPGTGRALWDARMTTPMEAAGIIDGLLVDDFGNSSNRVVKPGSLAQSILYRRVAEMGSKHMPPLATSELNHEAIALLSRWITNDLTGANSPPVAGVDTILRYPASGTRVLVSTLLANDSDANGDILSFVSVASTSTGGAAVSRQGDWIHYSPPAGFTNDDAFTYQITDSRSAPVTGTVNVVVSSDQVPSPNLTVTDLGNGSYRIRFDGIPDLTYRIEYTTNLTPAQWQTLGSATADENGMFQIVDTPPAGFGQRFYRSIYP
jgi:glucose/arabinose dehydrogenase/mono/diheme cytochrome c family protein